MDSIEMSTESTEVITTNPDVILDKLKPGKFDIKQFHEKFENHSKEALYALLSLQNNANPLKKGGEGIAFRCDTFILKNKQKYNAAENTVFDVISGWVSSNPEDKAYVIYARDVKQHMPYSDDSYVYKVLKSGTDGLKKKPLEFEYVDEKGRVKVIDAPWYELLTYDKDETSESPCISFTPTPLFKALLLSATVTHGAFYQINVAAQISASQPKTLYYYLESKKNYREYPTAIPGDFIIMLDELQDIVGYPDSYRYADINKRILAKTKELLDEIKEADFTIEYEPVKDYAEGSSKRVTVGVHIRIIKKNDIVIEESARQIEVNYDAEMSILKTQSLSDSEIQDVIAAYVKNNRDISFLTNAVIKVSMATGVKSKRDLLCWFMHNGLDNIPTKPSKKNGFNNFDGREYDYEELERLLLNSEIPN